MRAARLAGEPQALKDLPTSQRMVSFYMSWFSRVYHPTEAGWIVGRTPDDRPVAEQDAFFWFALEIVARELNTIRAEKMAEMTNR